MKEKSMGGYISSTPENVRRLLEKLRKTVKAAAPDAEEAMAYAMPTFRANGRNLVHFAAFRNHIGFYPTPSAITAFKDELSRYERSKGAIRFDMGKPIPYRLIGRIVKFRLKENLRGLEAKKNRKTCSRGHEYAGNAPCPACWPGNRKRKG